MILKIFSLIKFSTAQLRYGFKLFGIPRFFVAFVNPVNCFFFCLARRGSLVLNYGAFEFSFRRMQLFIRYLGFVDAGFITVFPSIFSRLNKLSVCATMCLSALCRKPFFVVKRYRPGILTNWRSSFSSLFFFRIPTPVADQSATGAQLDNATRWFDTVSLTHKFSFPGVALSFDAFSSLYLFSESERLGIPVLGPSSFFLNSDFWTYTYPVFSYSDMNVLFFSRLFALNYLKGRVNYFVLVEIL